MADWMLKQLPKFHVSMHDVIANILKTGLVVQQATKKDQRRLLVVANRLPVSISQGKNGQFDFNMASGGLVSALQSLSKTMEFQWFGWPGTEIHKNDQATIKDQLETRFHAVPVFLSQQTMNSYYSGFSNSVLWPLLHNMAFRAQFEGSWTDSYREVNETFAEHIVPHTQDGDLIWIHDYHLLLLPGILRDRLKDKKNIRIGFFLHTPFPTEDTFSVLPFREAICHGLLSSDLVGLHTRDYVETFLDAAAKVLPDVRRSPSDLHYQGRKLVVKEFPVGIDPDAFKKSVSSEETKREMKSLEQVFRGFKILLGVDRLDYIKGIPQKLKAFDRFLDDHPEWIGKLVLVQVAIPTRSDVSDYRAIRSEVEELVGNINGKHGTLDWTPIRYLYSSLKPEKLHALYAMSDVCIVSSVQDGLNLVSFEYVVCQVARKGVLLLSQYTGAAKLLTSAVLFNPWDLPRFSNAILTALEMPLEDRQRKHDSAIKTVETWTSMRWGMSFLDTLQTVSLED